MSFHLTTKKDKFVWSLTSFGEYTFKSLYLDLLNDSTKYLKKFI
jgi:hypothetical protein